MSLNKFGEKPWSQQKDEAHNESWQEESLDAIRAKFVSRELGIYDKKEVESKLHEMSEEVANLEELRFIEELKQIDKEIGVYLVGGSVRDAIFDKKPKDIDLVVNNISPVKLINILLKYGKVTFDRSPKSDLSEMNNQEKEDLIENSYGVIKFMPTNSSLSEPIDIAYPREDDYSQASKSTIRGIKRDVETKADPKLNITSDLERRDLTINAITVNLVNGHIHDPHEGIDDIVKRKIRTVGSAKERILDEDLSRGFRALRFACTFKADLDDETKKAIKEIFKPTESSIETLYKGDEEKIRELKLFEKQTRARFDISEGNLPKCLQIYWDNIKGGPRMAVPLETMSKEILKAIDADPLKFLELLEEVDGLKVLFPEIERLRHTEQPREHHKEGDVLTHTKMLLSNLPKDASLELKLAGLFHDLGKPDTKEFNQEKGKLTFYGHQSKSAEIVENIAERLKLTNEIKNKVVWLVEHHMLPHFQSSLSMKPSKMEKIFLKDEQRGVELLELAQADSLASLPEKGEPDIELINRLLSRINELKINLGAKEKMKVPALVTGKDLIGLGLVPGPQFGEILELVRDAQLEGRVKERNEAMNLIKKAVNQ